MAAIGRLVVADRLIVVVDAKELRQGQAAAYNARGVGVRKQSNLFRAYIIGEAVLMDPVRTVETNGQPSVVDALHVGNGGGRGGSDRSENTVRIYKAWCRSSCRRSILTDDHTIIVDAKGYGSCRTGRRQRSLISVSKQKRVIIRNPDNCAMDIDGIAHTCGWVTDSERGKYSSCAAQEISVCAIIGREADSRAIITDAVERSRIAPRPIDCCEDGRGGNNPYSSVPAATSIGKS